MQKVLLAYLMFFVSLLFYTYQYIIRLLPTFIMPQLMDKFGVSSDEIGDFASIYFIGYVVMHIPVGYFVDKFGAKLVMAVSSMMVLLGMLPIVYSDMWTLTLVGRVLVGMGSVASVLGMFKLIRIGFGAKKFGFMIGLTVTVAVLTIAELVAPVRALIEKEGADYFLNLVNISSAVTTMLIILVIPSEKYMRNVFEIEEKKSQSAREVYNDFVSVISNYKILLIATAGGLMMGFFEGFVDAWAIPFLEVIYKFDMHQSSIGAKSALYGMCVGSPVLGYVMERTKAYNSIIMISGLGMFIGAIILMMGLGNVGDVFSIAIGDTGFGISLSWNLVYFIMFILGVLSGYQVAVLGGAVAVSPVRLFSLTNASANMIMMGFGIFFHKAMGSIIESHALNSDGSYTKAALLDAMTVVPGAIVAGMVVLGVMVSVDKVSARRAALREGGN